MIDFFEEINKLGGLSLVNIVEPVQNKLLVRIKEATVSEQEEYLFIGEVNLGPARRISSDGLGAEYEVFFKSYGFYSITNESFAQPNENDEKIGRLFCFYSKSNYLDYVRKTTLVNYIYDYNDTLGHYSINCQNHVVDIISIDKPVIKKIS